jgi:hypothetical protein
VQQAQLPGESLIHYEHVQAAARRLPSAYLSAVLAVDGVLVIAVQCLALGDGWAHVGLIPRAAGGDTATKVLQPLPPRNHRRICRGGHVGLLHPGETHPLL